MNATASQATDEAIQAPEQAGPPRLELNERNAGMALGQLVLTLVELIRQLLERQAIRRIDAGSLNDEQVERLGVTFMELSRQMDRLKVQFGLKDEDLNLDLGPLGRVL